MDELEVAVTTNVPVCDHDPARYELFAPFWKEVDLDKELTVPGTNEKLVLAVTEPDWLKCFAIQAGDAVMVAEKVAEAQFGVEVVDTKCCGWPDAHIPMTQDHVMVRPDYEWSLYMPPLNNLDSPEWVLVAQGYTYGLEDPCIPYVWAAQNRAVYLSKTVAELMCAGTVIVQTPMRIAEVPCEDGSGQTYHIAELPLLNLRNIAPEALRAGADVAIEMTSLVEALLLEAGIQCGAQIGPAHEDPEVLKALGVEGIDLDRIEEFKTKRLKEFDEDDKEPPIVGDVLFKLPRGSKGGTA